MLETQKYLLSGKTLDEMIEEFQLRACYHPTKPLVILNYEQAQSKPDNHPIVMECRNLILEIGPEWRLVSRSFRRFFNYGQYPDSYAEFNWDSFEVPEKVDGSIMSAFWYDGEWMVTTRGSFAEGLCGESGQSWASLFHSVLPMEKIKKVCTPGYSYIFEFCGPWNRVVKEHKENKLYLLGMFAGEVELGRPSINFMSSKLGVPTPQLYSFKSMDEILAYIETQINNDPQWEGVIIVDNEFRRWKIKNPGYLALHRLANNGEGFKPKNLVRFIISGDEEEALVYINRHFPAYIPVFEETKLIVDKALAEVLELWEQVKDIASQKDFALAVVGKTKFSALFFNARKQGVSPQVLWPQAEDLILKVLFNS